MSVARSNFLERLCACAWAIAFGLALTLGFTNNAAAAPFEDNMAQRTLACTACHGAQGRAGPDGYYPRLAGKPAGYLYNQLISFKQGRRHYAPMERLISTLDDKYLLEMAQYFSSLSIPYESPKAAVANTELTFVANKLVEQGDAARGLPACAQCHGKALTGTQPHIPGLLGLPADYLLAQLGGWQNDQRSAQVPDCMAKVARMLKPAEVSALAQWLSSQTVPASSKAAAQLPAQRTSSLDITSPQWRCGAASEVASATAPQASANPAQVARGEYLARIGNCAQCHTAQGGAAYAGGRAIDTPFGAVMSGNLSPDATYGIGNWSAQDFWQALHHGISKDGRALYPAFPYTSYTQVTREDADALFAYLKTVPSSPTPNRAHTLRWPYNTQLALKVWRLLFFKPAADTPPNAAASAAADRGAYLVHGLGHCDECHTQRNAFGAMRADATQEGGVLQISQWYAPALQSPWLQRWSDVQLQTFLQNGISPHGYAAGPMAEVVQHGTRYLTNADALAMAQYLKRQAKGSPVLTASAAIGSDTLKMGGAIYDKQCADCHGKSGQGQSGAYPALAGNPNVQRTKINNLVLHILYGGYPASTSGNPRPFGMPPFVLKLSDAEIAAVLSYLRTSWGNHGGTVSEFDINKLRIALTQSP
jgi:mono/diheme cytochrome c family protein